MKPVVLACLGILLMTVGLGSCEDGLITLGEDETFSKTCPSNTLFGAIWAVYGHSPICEGEVINPIHEKCFGKSSCQFPVKNAFFGWDPCKNWVKHLDIEYRCWPKAVLAGVQPAHGTGFVMLQCPPEEKIEIVFVAYSYYGSGQFTNLKEQVTAVCGGKRTCHFSPHDHIRDTENRRCLKCRAAVYYRCAVSLKDQTQRCWPKEAEWVKFISPHVEENTELTLNCPANSKIGVMSATYRSRTYCGDFVHRAVDTQCFGKTSCQLSVTNAVFGDTCPKQPKFLDMTYGCWPNAANLGRLEMVHDLLNRVVTLTCPPNKRIEIVAVRFGYVYCFKYVTEPVDKRCTGQQTCQFPLTVSFLGDACHKKNYHAHAWYRCWPEEYWRCRN